MPKSSKDRRWQTVDSLEDLLSIVGTLYKSTEVIIAHAHHHDPLNTEASFDRIYLEGCDIQADLELLQCILSRRWADIVGDIKGQTIDNVLSFQDLKKAS
jgi:hypothetical protein